MKRSLTLAGASMSAIAALVAIGQPSGAGPTGRFDPAVIIAIAAWWITVLVAGYLAVISILAGAVVLIGTRPLARLVSGVTVPALRSVVLPAALAGSGLLPPIAAGASVTAPAPAVMVLADDPVGTPAVMVVVSPPTDAPVTGYRPLPDRWDDDDADGPAAPAEPPSAEPPSGQAPAEPGSPSTGPTTPAGPSTHVVADGEHCWSIAADHVHATLGTAPTVRQVTDYWRALLAANQDRFVTGNPDLIFPGQELLLP